MYEQLLFWINTVWRRRWAAILVAWFVCIAGWFFVASKPDTFTASTKVFIDTASILRPLLRGLAVERDIEDELQLMKQTVASRPNMERVARMTDLDLTAASPAAMQNLIDSLRRRTEIKSKNNLMTINFTDTDPVRARDVVEAILTVFIEQNLGQNREEIERARIFLDQQIAEYEVKLQEGEQRLADFRRDRLSTLPDRSTSSFLLEELRVEMEDTEVGLKRALVQRDSLRQQVAQGPATDISLELFKAEEEMRSLLIRFKDQHPDVLAVKRRIEDLEQQRSAELQRLGIDPDSAQPARAANESPLAGADYEQLKSMLVETDADVLILTDKAKRIRGQFQRLKRQVAQIPIVEAELSRLNRDYDVLKSKQTQLVGRREQAILSQKKEVGADRIRFQIVEPPRVPAVPNGPPRPMLLSAVLLFGLAAGAGFAIFLSIINETFHDPAKLQQAFNIKVLGIVTPVQTAARQTYALARHSTFLMSLTLLVGVYAVLTINISYIRDLKIGAVPGLEDWFLKFSTVLGL